LSETFTFGPLARYGNKLEQERGHGLGMKRTSKKKKILE
jgi:hypothetical protein